MSIKGLIQALEEGEPSKAWKELPKKKYKKGLRFKKVN